MKFRTIKFLLFIGVLLSSASNGLHAQTVSASNFELWLEGRILGDQMIAVLDAENSEIREYVAANDIESVIIDFYWTSNEGDHVKKNTTDISVSPVFDYSSWSYEIPELDTINGVYTFTITENNANCSAQIPFVIGVDEVVEIDETPEIVLPDFECGVEPDPEVLTGAGDLQSVFNGDVLKIGGFPVLMQSVVGDATLVNGLVSGTAVIPLPFAKKTVKVDLSGIKVNSDGQVVAGEIIAMADNPANYPDFAVNPGVLTIGGDICLPDAPDDVECFIEPSTGYTRRGFDAEGNHRDTGTPYDKFEFDKEGIHKITGTEYNEAGCSAEGIDKDGNPCNPAGGPNQVAIDNALQYDADLDRLLDSILMAIKIELTSQKTNANCENYRTEMNTLLTTLGYSRAFIFGQDDKYIKPGLHKEFAEEPKPFQINTSRDENVVKLEENHIDLYKCDKLEYALIAYLSKVDSLIQNIETYRITIYQEIESWSQTLITRNRDKGTYLTWLRLQITNAVKENANLDQSYYQLVYEHNLEGKSRKEVEDIFQFDGINYSHMVAAADDAFTFDNSFTLDDASFLFRQGEHAIGGVDRAFFLEELSRQQMMALEANQPNTGLLPIRVPKTIGNKTYCIYLDNIRFTTSGATLDAYIIIEHPETGQRFVLKAMNVGFGPAGVRGESSLTLLSDVELRLNNAAKLILKGDGKTNVKWDCDGFVSMGVSTEIEFCRDKVMPLDELTLEPIDDTTRYRLQLEAQEITEWFEFTVEVNAPPFALVKNDNIKWQVDRMIIDFSSTFTSDFVPIEGYASPHFVGGKIWPRWQGFYMEELRATLPDDFNSSAEPITAGARDILIDGNGFTGTVFAENLISIEKGNLDGWAFSIQDFQVTIINNSLSGAGFGGKINVPIMEANLDYTASIMSDNKYEFVVSPDTVVNVPLFLAEMNLHQNSEISVAYSDLDGFKAVANLNGEITSRSDSTAIKFDFPTMAFQGLKISNKRPYFEVGTWGIERPLGVGYEFGGFGLTLDNVRPYQLDDVSSVLGVDLNISLSSGNTDIAAGGDFGIKGKLTEIDGRQKWIYDGILINELRVNASLPGVSKLNGLLRWYGNDDNFDPIYGKGFQGALDAQFDFIKVDIKAVAQFGKIEDDLVPDNNFKYFFIDAMAELQGTGIPAGPITFKGFGGGISKRMSKEFDAVSFANLGNNDFPDIGRSYSNTIYTPDKNIGLGLKALAIITTTSEEIFNGTVSIDFTFNSEANSGGLAQIRLNGAGQFLSVIDEGIKPEIPDIPVGVDTLLQANAPTSVQAPLKAFIDLAFNFNEPSFHGELGAYLNLPGIRGTGIDGKVVTAEIHFDPKKWYIYIGTPDDPAGLVVRVPIVGSADLTAYMDIGTLVPSMPPIPSKVREIASKINTNESLRRSGAGLVFGASLRLDFNAEFGKWASARVAACAGFDVMVRKYEGVTCSGSNDPVGINGWYAGGQMWAYVSGELQVKNINILKASLAAALQARLPNPFWAQASLGLKVKILFIKIKASLKLELGSDCELVSSNPDDEIGVEIISFINPFEEAENVETNAYPEVYFNFPMGKIFEITDLNDNTRKLKGVVAESVLQDSLGNTIQLEKVWSSDSTSIQFRPLDGLAPNTGFLFTVKVDIRESSEVIGSEERTVNFRTGDLQTIIPLENIKAAYPYDNMVNFYKKEYKDELGYIELNYGQSDLLDPNNVPDGYEQKIIISAVDQSSVQVIDYIYDAFDRKIRYRLSPDMLVNGRIYNLELVRFPTSLNPEDFVFEDPSPEDNLEDVGPIQQFVIYKSTFRVSQYDDVKSKLFDVLSSNNTELIIFGDSLRISATKEPFGINEIKRDNDVLDKFEPVLSFKTGLTSVDNPWYVDFGKPALDRLADRACNDPFESKEIDLDELVNTIRFQGDLPSMDYYLNTNQSIVLAPLSIHYYLQSDLNQIETKLLDKADLCNVGIDLVAGTFEDILGDTPPEPLYDPVETFPSLIAGDYGGKVTYTLPGSGGVTTDLSITFRLTNTNF